MPVAHDRSLRGWCKPLLLVILLALSGCADKPIHPRWLWPPPPAEPRLEFIRTFSSQQDLLPSRKERLLDKVSGNGRRHALFFPVGLAPAGPGQIIVADQDRRSLRRYTLHTGEVRQLAGPDLLHRPLDLASTGDGSLFLVDQSRVLRLAADGSPQQVIGEDLLENPAYLAVNEVRGRLYVADSEANRIQVFSLAGEPLFAFGEGGAGDGQLHGPQGLAIDPQGRVFVADFFNARIQIFSADGDYLWQFGRRDAGPGGFEGPKDLAFDSAGHLFIVDSRKNALLTYTPGGELLLVTGGGPGTSHPLGFRAPAAIHIDGRDRIYISDRMNHRVSIWQYLTPAYLERHPISEDDLANLNELRRR